MCMRTERVPHPSDEVKKAEKEYAAAEARGEGAAYRQKYQKSKPQDFSKFKIQATPSDQEVDLMEPSSNQ